MTQLKVLCDTVLKQQPIQASKLAADQLQTVKAGTLLNVQSYGAVSDHIKVALSDRSFQGKNTWYIYQRHGAILESGKVAFPPAVKLSVPYYDQLDNSENPYGTCNVTSIAMCLAYLGAVRKHPEQRFPDELQDYCTAHGLDRHSSEVLAKLVEVYGCRDTFKTTASFEEVKEWLIQGNPVVVQGYFTHSGHIVVFVGYNADGYVVNDPYGALTYNSSDDNEYDIYGNGAGITYSYNVIYDVCCTDNEFWVHFISKS